MRRRLIVALAALALLAATLRLGWWQLDRASHKEALQRAIAAQMALPPLDGRALAFSAAQLEPQLQRRALLRGRWLPEWNVYLDNRPMDGRPGFFMLTPLLLADGSAVVVQRGWLPRDAADRTRLASVETPVGEVELLGRIAASPSRAYELGTDAGGSIRQNLALDAYARETGLALRPLALLQLEPERVLVQGTAVAASAVAAASASTSASKAAAAPVASAAASVPVLRRDWPPPALDVAKHYGYAAQWFALAALTTGLYVWFQLIRPRLRRR